MTKQTDQSYRRSNGHVLVVGILIAFSLLVIMTAKPIVAAVVTFPDSGLEAAVRHAIGKLSGNIHSSAGTAAGNPSVV